ncbi:MAG: DegT/DnrJ/EryC1/StrS family aminotransferase [Candidatus Latescibacteria bacterium]|nr:DegT/DnrJ/EryC1/StrS family aminotransferase [Candidatus Latescibacterota bacterium]
MGVELAVDGGTPVRDTTEAPWPDWPANSEKEWVEEIEPTLKEVYLNKSEGLPAPMGAKFGQAFAAYCDAAYGMMMPSGTTSIAAGISAALDLDGLVDGGEVIIPNYTFIATASAPLSVRCSLALVDVDPVSFTMLPEAVESAITDKTVALLPVHLGGHPADMGALNAIAKKHGLKVIEDCAQAHGAEYKGRKVGSLGDVGAFSFQSSKNLTSGEGGCLLTNDKDIRDRAWAFRDVGRRPGGERWEYPRLGWNYRTSEYLAGILLTRLTHVQGQTELRNQNAAYLSKALDSTEGLTPPQWRPWVTHHGYHLYMMLYESEAFGGKSRDAFIKALKAEGVPCSPGYQRPLTDEGGIKTVAEKHPHLINRHPCPNVESTCQKSVWLSQNVLLAPQEDMDDILSAISKIRTAFTQ